MGLIGILGYVLRLQSTFLTQQHTWMKRERISRFFIFFMNTKNPSHVDEDTKEIDEVTLSLMPYCLVNAILKMNSSCQKGYIRLGNRKSPPFFLVFCQINRDKLSFLVGSILRGILCILPRLAFSEIL